MIVLIFIFKNIAIYFYPHLTTNRKTCKITCIMKITRLLCLMCIHYLLPNPL